MFVTCVHEYRMLKMYYYITKNKINFNILYTRNIVKALEVLLATGCETVIITLGENGAAYISKKEKDPIHVICDSVTPVDTTVTLYIFP